MLVPVKARIAFQLDGAESVTQVLEDALSIKPLLFPKVLAFNVDEFTSFQVSVDFKLLLGTNEDPLNAGNFTQTPQPFDETVAPRRVVVYTPNLALDGSLVNVTQHVMTIKNLGTATAIIQIIITGLAEVTAPTPALQIIT